MKRAAVACLLLSGSVSAAPTEKCETLAHTSFGADVKIESTKIVAATGTLREYCDVRGVIWPEARFAVKLPTFWNNRFEMVGGGGWAGTISLPQVDAAVRDGYAATSTDTGHDAQKEPGASFAYPGSNNPNAARKVIDHGYLAVHETALLAKKLIREYYGRDPQYSYWVGCSTGGRQGLMEAQRYPEDFDGYVIGAPVLDLSGLQMKAVWNYQQAGAGPGKLSGEKLDLLSKAVYRKCDGLDGLEDGLIENPLACDFDPARDLDKCPGDWEGPACFTGAQIAALKKIYQGPRDSSGRQLFPGMPPGGDGAAVNSFRLADTFMKFMAFDPAPGPSWDYRTFNFDTDARRKNCALPRLGRPGRHARNVGELLRSRHEDHGPGGDARLLPPLLGARHVSLRRRTRLRQRRLAGGRRKLGGEGNSPFPVGGLAPRRRPRDADPAPVRLPGRGPLQRHRQY